MLAIIYPAMGIMMSTDVTKRIDLHTVWQCADNRKKEMCVCIM